MIRTLITLSLLIWAGAATAAVVDYPARPIRIIIPNAPGSTTDILGRIIFMRMSDRLGKQLVVDNRPGAGGTLGLDIAAHATPDGYNLAAVAASQLTIGPHVYRKIGYLPLHDFTPVGLYVKAQTALCVNNALPVKTVQDFIVLANSKPGQLLMASAGVGSTSHLGGLMFAMLAHIKAEHVPYKGGGPSVAAVAQGEAQWTVPPLSAAMPHVQVGRIRCLATGGDRRSAVMRDMPTIAESGVPGFLFYGWNGVIAPRGTSRQHIAKLNRVMNEVLETDEVRKLYANLGEEPFHDTPDEFAKLIRVDYDRMGKLAKQAGLKVD